MTSQRLFAPLLLLAGCVLAGSASAAMDRNQYRGEMERAQGSYRAAWNGCKPLKGNAKDVCQAEARGAYAVTKAELAARLKTTPKNADKVKTQRAETALRVDTEKCDELSGNARAVCRKDAKASFVGARSEVRVDRAAVEQGVNSRALTSERKEARADTSQAQFTAAKERCDALSGADKSTCLGDARKKYGKL